MSAMLRVSPQEEFERSGDVDEPIDTSTCGASAQMDSGWIPGCRMACPRDFGAAELGDASTTSLNIMSDASCASGVAQTDTQTIGTQTDEYVDDITCQTCGEVRVPHGCGHWQCTTLTCQPTWYQRFEARKWLAPRTPARTQHEQLSLTRERCVDCRPEGRCLKGACPRYCNFVFRRGTCKHGAKCSFCHLHGRADAPGNFSGKVDGVLDLPWPPSASHVPPPPKSFLTKDKQKYPRYVITSDGMKNDPTECLRGCCSVNEPWKVAYCPDRLTANAPSPQKLAGGSRVLRASPKVGLDASVMLSLYV
ncbi:unnamed protein product [Prorocentrum cordatum]|uniref:C3H1-type domain-containing protein n=1 Tax=Prorocentrum cordatum TaxID=2364126 RepID=A0ABN9TJK0_9DINO|nr:unnamed protein product [Polarella glacialis]